MRIDLIDGKLAVLDDEGKILSEHRSNEDAWRGFRSASSLRLATSPSVDRVIHKAPIMPLGFHPEVAVHPIEPETTEELRSPYA